MEDSRPAASVSDDVNVLNSNPTEPCRLRDTSQFLNIYSPLDIHQYVLYPLVAVTSWIVLIGAPEWTSMATKTEREREREREREGKTETKTETESNECIVHFFACWSMITAICFFKKAQMDVILATIERWLLLLSIGCIFPCYDCCSLVLLFCLFGYWHRVLFRFVSFRFFFFFFFLMSVSVVSVQLLPAMEPFSPVAPKHRR